MAALVFLVAAWLLLGVVIHIVGFLFSTALLVAAVVAVVGLARPVLATMAYVIIAVCFGLAGGVVGKIKGSSFLLWFLISGLVPFFGLLAAIAYRFERDELPSLSKLRARHEDLRRALHALRSRARFPRRRRRAGVLGARTHRLDLRAASSRG